MPTAIIIDDTPSDREKLKALLLGHPDIEVVAECDSAQTGLVAIACHRPQLVFLDVQMPEMTGLEMLAKMQVRDFQVIFITSFEEFAVKAFRMASLDYILKPVKAEELDEALKRFSIEEDKEYRAAQHDVLAKHVQLRSGVDMPLAIKGTDDDGRHMHFLTVSDIVYTESEAHKTHFYLKDYREVVANNGLSHYRNLLRKDGIIQIEKRNLINPAHLIRYSKADNQVTLRLRDKEKILKVGAIYKDDFEKSLML